MKIFVTGATGFIGSRLALRLAELGHTVHALYRDEEKLSVITHPGIVPFKGDILDEKSLEIAAKGCRQVYHTAAFASVWTPDPSKVYKLNIEGTMNVIRAGTLAGAEKFVCTSTAGVFGPSGRSAVKDENSPKPASYFIDYESSKAILEGVLHRLADAGVPVVTVNPTRVYGPGLLSESNGVTRMVISYYRGKWRFIPGNGESTGNYVFVEDVVNGHILAMEKGVPGQNYLLGGSNASFNELFSLLALITGKKRTMLRIPSPLMLGLAAVMLGFAKTAGKSPMITPPLVRRFTESWNISSEKAARELGYRPIDLKSGLEITLEWIKNDRKP